MSCEFGARTDLFGQLEQSDCRSSDTFKRQAVWHVCDDIDKALQEEAGALPKPRYYAVVAPGTTHRLDHQVLGRVLEMSGGRSDIVEKLDSKPGARPLR